MHNLFVFFLPFLLYNSDAELGEGIVDGWNPIPNVTEPTVVDIGKSAVDEHNKNDGASLKFQKVVKGESQRVRGMNYKLTITAVDGSVENKYEAVVLDIKWEKFRQLVSFKGPV